MAKPIALIVSDLHLSSKRPSCREDDWMQVQGRMLSKITKLAKEYSVPVLCAGDIFDTPKEDPAVEALALRWMRQVPWYAIPGQHDLPGHALMLMGESSFGVLVESGILNYCEGAVEFKDFWLGGFPFGAKPMEADLLLDKKEKLRIGMGHTLVWKEEPYPGASEKGLYTKIVRQYKGYDVLIFGDNHKGFSAEVQKGKGKTLVLVPGCATRRTRAEIEYKIGCWLLHDDKTAVRLSLPRAKDLFCDPGVEIKNNNLQEFVTSLQNQVGQVFSFLHTLEVYLNETEDIRPEVKELLWSIVEKR